MAKHSRPQRKWVSEEGEERKSDSKVVKCTCGKSKKMPFCDGSHRKPWHKLTMSQNIRGLVGGKDPSKSLSLSGSGILSAAARGCFGGAHRDVFRPHAGQNGSAIQQGFLVTIGVCVFGVVLKVKMDSLEEE